MALENACLHSTERKHQQGKGYEYHCQADDSGAGSCGIAGESLLAHQFYVDHLAFMLKEAEALVLRAHHGRIVLAMPPNGGKSFYRQLHSAG